MLYLGIDQHRKHLTVDAKDPFGRSVLHRQVRTRPEAVRKFFEEFGARAASDGGYVACVEVCGFNQWLVELLRELGCRSVVLTQPDQRSLRKTDRRDACRLSELLWLNAHRLAEEGRLEGMRQVMIPTAEQGDDRRLTAMRRQAGGELTRVINRVRGVLRRHNLEWSCPTKGIQTQKARIWLAQLRLGAIERCEMNQLLERWSLLDRQLAALDLVIGERFHQSPDANILASIPGAANYSALAVACRIGPIKRFAHPRSLANFLGLTPRSRNSGAATQRLGSITKEGSAMVRFVLAQWTLHPLRRDARMREWFRAIKRRRGAKIARVAVMRRLSTIAWRLLSKREPYRELVAPQTSKRRRPEAASNVSQGS